MLRPGKPYGPQVVGVQHQWLHLLTCLAILSFLWLKTLRCFLSVKHTPSSMKGDLMHFILACLACQVVISFSFILSFSLILFMFIVHSFIRSAFIEHLLYSRPLLEAYCIRVTSPVPAFQEPREPGKQMSTQGEQGSVETQGKASINLIGTQESRQWYTDAHCGVYQANVGQEGRGHASGRNSRYRSWRHS